MSCPISGTILSARYVPMISMPSLVDSFADTLGGRLHRLPYHRVDSVSYPTDGVYGEQCKPLLGRG